MWQALRNKSYGVGLDFVWSPFGSGDYAIRESTSRIKVRINCMAALSSVVQGLCV